MIPVVRRVPRGRGGALYCIGRRPPLPLESWLAKRLLSFDFKKCADSSQVSVDHGKKLPP
jgi:hypothetical protein